MDVTVIFVSPESWGNVGSIARCMKNFGFTRLVLVTDGKPGDEARTLAMHAADILESALIVPTLEEALALVETSIATTCVDGSDKNFRKVTLSPRQLSFVAKGRVGIVLGREGSGLTNTEIAACNVVVRIPTSPEYPAMNVSHACCVLLYELSRVPPRRKYRNATRLEKDLILEDVSEIIRRIDTREFKRRVGSDVFGAVLERSFMTGREAYTLKGIFRKLRRKLEKTG